MPSAEQGPGAPASACPPEAPLDCGRCARLTDFRAANKTAHPDWFNAPAPSFGDANAELLIVGLAPGLQGANRTGRPFTGDFAGDLLYATIAEFGFSSGRYDARPDDGLCLRRAMITNAVRCVPPKNKPTAAEIKTCRPFLKARIETMSTLRAILCLGRISHESVVDALGIKRKDAPFGHGARHRTDRPGLKVFDSYHCSRYNTNTGRLTTAMFASVFADICDHLAGRKPPETERS